MKALPPVSPQLELLPCRRQLALSVVEPNARLEILCALAEILLVAAEAVEKKEDRDDAR